MATTKELNWLDRQCAMSVVLSDRARHYQTKYGLLDVRALWEFQAGKCGLIPEMGCQVELTLETGRPSDLEVDHILPVRYYPYLKKSWQNLQLLCRSCNRTKSDTVDPAHRMIVWLRAKAHELSNQRRALDAMKMRHQELLCLLEKLLREHETIPMQYLWLSDSYVTVEQIEQYFQFNYQNNDEEYCDAVNIVTSLTTVNDDNIVKQLDLLVKLVKSDSRRTLPNLRHLVNELDFSR